MSQQQQYEAIDASVLFENKQDIVSDNICAICYDTHTDNSYIIPECSHKFHVNCIIPWYRSNVSANCPCCRSTPNTEDMLSEYIPYNTRTARYSFNRKFAQRKNAPKDLKKLVERLRKAERKRTTKGKEYTAWTKTLEGKKWSSLNKKRNQMRGHRRCYRRFSNTERGLRAKISEYPIIPVPVLI